MALIFEEGLHFEASDLQVCWVPDTKPARGSWTREGSQGCWERVWYLTRWPLRPGTMKGHGYVILAGWYCPRDSDVSTCAAWSMGHSAIHSLLTRRWVPLFWVGLLWDGQASWVNPWVWTHWVRTAVRSTVVQRGVRYTSLVNCWPGSGRRSIVDSEEMNGCTTASTSDLLLS